MWIIFKKIQFTKTDLVEIGSLNRPIYIIKIEKVIKKLLLVKVVQVVSQSNFTILLDNR